MVIADRTNPQQPVLTVRGIQRDTVEIIIDERFRTVSAEEYDVVMHKPLKPVRGAVLTGQVRHHWSH